MSQKRSPTPIETIPLPTEAKESIQKSKRIKIRRSDDTSTSNEAAGSGSTIDNFNNGGLSGKGSNIIIPSQTIVDELFKDFIAQKQAVPLRSDAPMAKPLGSGSINEMNAFLDHEISLIGTQKPCELLEDTCTSTKKHKKKRKHATSDERKHRHKKKKRERERGPTFEDIHDLEDKVDDSIEGISDRVCAKLQDKSEKEECGIQTKSKHALRVPIHDSEFSGAKKLYLNVDRKDQIGPDNKDNVHKTYSKHIVEKIDSKESVDKLVPKYNTVDNTGSKDKLDLTDKVEKMEMKYRDKTLSIDKVEKTDTKDQAVLSDKDKNYKDSKYSRDKSDYKVSKYKDKIKCEIDVDKADKIKCAIDVDKDRFKCVIDVDKDRFRCALDVAKYKADKAENKGSALLSRFRSSNCDDKEVIIIDEDVDIPPKNAVKSTSNIKLPTTVSNITDDKFSTAKFSTAKVAIADPASAVFDLESIPLPVLIGKHKAPVAKLGLNLKISSNVAEFIASGEKVDKKGKRREEGEVSSGTNDNSSNNEDEDDEDEEDDDESKISETGSLPDSADEKSSSKGHKKKKKHKMKHKKKKKHKTKGKEKDTEKEKDKGQKKKKKDSKSRSDIIEYSKDKKKSKHHDKDRSRSRSRSRSGSRTKRHKSNKILDRGWDAYSYMQDCQREDTYKRDQRVTHRHDSHSKSQSRSRSRSRRKSRSRSRSRTRRKSRSRSHSRTQKNSSDHDLCLHIDKKKLRKIAIANALANLKSGECSSADLASLKSGGKSVKELTDFCKGLAVKERGEFSSSDSSDLSHSDDDHEPFINHPFKVREAPAIIMNIRNAKQIPIMTQTEKNSGVLRSQFPVSSGNQHRLKELEWVPVEKTTTPVIATTTTTVSVTTGGTTTATTTTATTTTTTTTSNVTMDTLPTPQVASVVVDPVFPKPVTLPIDIGAIVSERLQAVRKLQENPYDVQALSKMHKSQEKASQWATSQFQPGQFTGSTGVQILSKQELEGSNRNNKAWLRKDQFKKAEPVKSGIGMFLLQKMGWKAGEGLGKNNEGSLEPLLLDLKVDRKGLQTQSEVKFNQKPNIRSSKKGGSGGGGQTLPKDLSGKHPVSALLELCNRRKFVAPYFDLIHESGPDHKKNFLFKVLVNGTEYQPSIVSNNKKTAKSQAALVCLQELGMVPRHGPI